MDNLAKIRRWISKNDYESIGTFLDKNREMDIVEFDYLNKYVPQEKKEAWNKFVENNIKYNIDVSHSYVDSDRKLRVDRLISSGGLWNHMLFYDVRITVGTLQKTPLGNEVRCSVRKDKTTWIGETETLTLTVSDSHENLHLKMYHKQTFKFNL